MYNIDNELIFGKSKVLEEMKKNTGICAECGGIFEQGYIINPKTGTRQFNKYKYCPKCRIKVAKKK